MAKYSFWIICHFGKDPEWDCSRNKGPMQRKQASKRGTQIPIITAPFESLRNIKSDLENRWFSKTSKSLWVLFFKIYKNV